MANWRMNLHPTEEGDLAMMRAVEALARNLIGFGYKEDPGVLTKLDPSLLPKNVRPDERRAAAEMATGDKVLVMVHNVPFALATVTSRYNYVLTPIPEISSWFNHFWRVGDVMYYADRPNNPPSRWPNIPTTMTIQRLTEGETQTLGQIEGW